MRLYKFLNEKDILDLYDQVQEFNDNVKKYCKPYLRLIKGKEPLVRGMSPKGDQFIDVQNVRKNRIPFGMTDSEANALNNWLEQNGHNRRDKSVMCKNAKDPNKLLLFGTSVCYIFPIGNISYTFIRADDANLEDKRTGWDYDAITDHLIADENPNYLKLSFEEYFVTDRSFDDAYWNHYEIWINCDKYFYVNMSKLEILKSKWDGNKQIFK